jgi:hypothetical protein
LNSKPHLKELIWKQPRRFDWSQTFVCSFFVVTRFELRASHLLGRHPTTLAMLLDLFVLVYFSGRILWFCLGQVSNGDLLTYSLSHRWDHRHMPPYLANRLRWGRANFLPPLVLNHSPLNFCLPNNQDDRCEPLCPVSDYKLNKR